MNQDAVAGKNQKKEEIAGGRGKETLFRVSSRNQIELIAIADNKANIIVGISAILISLIIALLGSGVAIGGSPVVNNMEVLVPFVILLVFSLVACILAIIAARPVMIKTSLGKIKTRSLVFFDYSFNESLDQYMENTRKLLANRSSIYDQMMIEMYNNGLVLKRKYTYLSVAYLIFMIGFLSATLVGVAGYFL
ncbi:MAG: hypothetical protein HKN76_18940 [Saprospiraceae bacterium]|nr:hypothetical protein [Saprospiraceae bacterium]